MPPIGFEKSILRRITPTWTQILNECIDRGALNLEDIEQDSPLIENQRYGFSSGLVIVSPGLDLNRCLFYLCTYILNPLHIHSINTVTSNPYDCRGIQNFSLRLLRGYYDKIFNLALELENVDVCPQIDRKLFRNVKVQSALEMRRRLVLILGLEPEQCVVTATTFACTMKRITKRVKDTKPDEFGIILPHVEFMDYSFLVAEREKMYTNGGIYAVPARILVVDLLTAKIVPELISGIIIYKAHCLNKDANAVLTLKLIKSRNRYCWIKAISDNPSACTPVSQILKHIFTRHFFIYPRCCESFEKVLNNPKVQPETVQVRIQPSQVVVEIQTAILNLIQRLVTELQKNKRYQDIDMNRIIYSRNTKVILEQRYNM
ncbi:uncharacterized protein BdWA1_003667, partial [Babesia duncani]